MTSHVHLDFPQTSYVTLDFSCAPKLPMCPQTPHFHVSQTSDFPCSHIFSCAQRMPECSQTPEFPCNPDFHCCMCPRPSHVFKDFPCKPRHPMHTDFPCCMCPKTSNWYQTSHVIPDRLLMCHQASNRSKDNPHCT